MSLTTRLARHIEDHLARHAEAPVSRPGVPREITQRLHRTYGSFEQPADPEAVFDDVTDLLWQWGDHATNRRHFGLTRPTVDRMAVIADSLVALYDPNLATWDFSPPAQLIERYTLDFVAHLFGDGFDSPATHFTSGGQEANHTAVAAALTASFPDLGMHGLRQLDAQPVMYLSEEGHHSFDKVAHITGIGRTAVRMVPTTRALVLDVDELEEMVLADKRDGLAPFLVVGTAGTINAGEIDPLDDIADVASRHGLWFHVDAAWGGAAAISPMLRPLLTGIERADSITCDAHKLFSTTVGAGMFFSRRVREVQATFTTSAAYVPDHQGEDKVYPYVTSMQWSRRFIGLKLFMMLAVHGAEGVARRIEHQTAMGNYLRTRLTEHDWELLNEASLPVVCFTHPALTDPDREHPSIVATLKRNQDGWISKTTLSNGRHALRASVTNYDTRREDIDALVAGLARAVEALSNHSGSAATS